MQQQKDQIGIITMGDYDTNNDEQVDYVKLYQSNLSTPDWDMVKYVNALSPTRLTCDWIQALIVALCFVKKNIGLVFNK